MSWQPYYSSSYRSYVANTKHARGPDTYMQDITFHCSISKTCTTQHNRNVCLSVSVRVFVLRSTASGTLKLKLFYMPKSSYTQVQY